MGLIPLTFAVWVEGGDEDLTGVALTNKERREIGDSEYRERFQEILLW